MEKEKRNKRKLFESGVLSFQHMFAMLGATVVVPLIANMSVTIALLTAGLGTIIFYLVTKKKVPVFLGSSFAFLAALSSIMSGTGDIGSDTWNEKMGGMVIAIWLTGLVYVLLSFITKWVGVKKVRSLFPPHVVGPVVIVIGMILAPKILYNNIMLPTMNSSADGFIEGWKSWSTAVVTLITIFVAACFSKPKSFFKVAPILLGFVVGYVYALCIGIVDFSGKMSVDRIVIFQQIPQLFGFFKHLHFDGTAVVLLVPLALVTFMEHLGDISANSTVCGHDFMLDPGIDRTLLGDGLAIIMAGTLGGPPQTTYGENTAILAITKNYDPKNIFYAACLAVLFGVFSIFGDFITTIPQPVIGGASIILFGMISASGLRSLIDNHVDLGETKNLLIVSIILALGLGFGALSFVSDVTKNDAYRLMIGDIELSPLAICTIVGILLNLILPNDKKEPAEPVVAE